MERKLVPDSYKWKVSDVFAADEAWEKSYSEAESKMNFSAFKGKLGEAEKLAEFFKAQEEAGALLGRQGIAVRAGLHCAPAAHQAMGTLEQGAVRMAPSAFSSFEEIEQVAAGFRNIVRSHR